MRRALSIGVLLAVTAAACGGTGSNKANDNPNSTKPVTIDLWTFATGLELKKVAKLVDRFHAKYPYITVKVTGAKGADSDNGALKLAATSSRSPDVGMMNGPDDIGQFCAKGLFRDLTSYITRDKVDMSVFTKGTLDYTSSAGKQCSLPLLTDAYGLYYNTKMFQQKGITSPPKTYSELLADMKKLTVFNPDGSIKVLGFLPLVQYESAQLENGVWSGAQWYTPDGKSAFGSDPRWAPLFQWQKSLIDWIGYAKLQAFFARLGGPNSEWNAQQGFMTGKIAMALDGEWRVAFIHDFKSNVPYATAPFPVADNMAQSYGLGQIGGDIIAIPKGAPHPAEAWLLVKYLALNTQAEVKLADLLKNVPTTYASLRDPTLVSDPHFATFLKIFANPGSAYKQITTLGTGDATLEASFANSYLAGKVSDLQAGLANLASQIDKQGQLG